MNWKILVTSICAIVFIVLGLLFILGTFVPTAKHIKQDAWLSEKPDEEPPIAILMFTFTSKGDFAEKTVDEVTTLRVVDSGGALALR